MRKDLENRIRWVCAGGIVFAFLLRALASVTRVPGWEQDPAILEVPSIGLTPATGFLLDALVALTAAVILWLESVTERRAGMWSGLAILAGVLGVALHGWWLTPLVAEGGTGVRGSLPSLSLGSAWASALIGAWALRLAARHEALRHAVVGVLIGVVAVWCAKGGYQFLIEHPRTVAAFDANREAWLAANGWEPGSTSARLFERRLRQPEAIGWFGLANVFGSVVGACAIAWSILAAHAIRCREPVRNWSPLVLAMMISWLALAMSGSKGAIGLALLLAASGTAIVLRPSLADLLKGLRGWIGWLILSGMLAAVVARGLIGERLAELSLLFRWHYLIGAARVVAEHPVFGVGPAGFKDAYLLAKPPLNPEEVESPHSLPLDWLAAFGLFAAGWLALWLAWARKAGMNLLETVPAAHSGPPHPDPSCRPFRLTVIAAAVLTSLLIERDALLAEWLICLAVASLGWFWLSGVASRAFRQSQPMAGRAIAAAALALCAHALIEVTFVAPGAAGWAMGLLAMASVPTARSDLGAVPGRKIPRVRASIAAVWAASIILFAASPAFLWQRALEDAAGTAGTLRKESLESGVPPDRSRMEEVQRRVSGAVQREPMVVQPVDVFAGHLFLAASENRALGRTEATLALADGGVLLLSEQAARLPRSAARWARLAGALQARGALTGRREDLRSAFDAWVRVAELDPHGLGPARQAAWLAAASDLRHEAARWADRALEIDRSLRLDPLRRLTDSERQDLSTLVDLPASD